MQSRINSESAELPLLVVRFIVFFLLPFSAAVVLRLWLRSRTLPDRHDLQLVSVLGVSSRISLFNAPSRFLLCAHFGIVAGVACGFALQQLAGSYFDNMQTPGMWVVAGAASVLLVAAVVASAVPAARAARVDVIQALRAE